MNRLLLLFLAVGYTCFCFAKPSPPYEIQVRFDNIAYSLRGNGTQLVYQDGVQHYQVPVQGCNRDLVNALTTKLFQFLEKLERPMKKTPYDVVVEVDGEGKNVLRGSSFGTWLRHLPDSFPTLYAQSKAKCEKQ